MEVSAQKNPEGGYYLEMGNVTFVLPEGAIEKIQQVISQRLTQSSVKDEAAMKRKIMAYRNVAAKLVSADDRIVQDFILKLETEQLVTVTRLGGDKLFDKIVRNLSRQGQSQFEDDFNRLSEITEHKAILNMEKIIPILKEVAKARAR